MCLCEKEKENKWINTLKVESSEYKGCEFLQLFYRFETASK